MLLIRILANRKPPESVTTAIKDQHGLLGYSGPHQIWVAASNELTQTDVAVAQIYVDGERFAHDGLEEFCRAVGTAVQTGYGDEKSVEVHVHVVAKRFWLPTDAGRTQFGDT